MKKIKIYSELVYVIALFGLSFSVAMAAAADFGVSMIVAPAYIMSLKFTFFTFGQWDYILQGTLFIAFCLAMKKFKPIYLVSFATCVIYGTVLDMWRAIIPHFNIAITPAGSMAMTVRIIYFVLSMFLTAATVALFFRVYIYPQVCDLFVTGITSKYNINRIRFKKIFDCSCLALSLILTLLFFGKLKGIGVGTLIVTLLNGMLIGAFGKIYDRYFEIIPALPKFAEKFEY